jgi:hypothetical protein
MNDGNDGDFVACLSLIPQVKKSLLAHPEFCIILDDHVVQDSMVFFVNR